MAPAIALAAALAAVAPPCRDFDSHRLDVPWLRANCQPLTAEDDPRVADVLERLRQLERARGLPPSEILVLGAPPRPHAYVTRDRVIVMTSKVLDLCYSKPKQAPSSLAFVLAHELAHLLHGDAQRAGLAEQDTRFFEAAARALDDNELRADASALFDVARIGLDPQEILGGALLRAWAQADGGGSGWQERKNLLGKTSRDVVQQLPLFDASVDFVAAGQYASAAGLLDLFRKRTGYDGREILSDLGFAKTQEVLANLDRAAARRLMLPGAFDAQTFARKLERGASVDWPGVERDDLEPLRRELQRALDQSPDYLPARLNLATVMLLSGDAASVLDLLKDLKVSAAEQVEVGVARALALYLMGQAPGFEAQRAQAVKELRALATGAPSHVAAAYNLARMLTELKEPEAEQAWRRVLKLDPPRSVRDAAREALRRLSRADESTSDVAGEAAASKSACADPLPDGAPAIGLLDKSQFKMLEKAQRKKERRLLDGGTRWLFEAGTGSVSKRTTRPPPWRAYVLPPDKARPAVVELVVERLELVQQMADPRARHGTPESELALADGRRVLRYDACAFIVDGDGRALERVLFNPQD